jgi:hypothetical protein
MNRLMAAIWLLTAGLILCLQASTANAKETLGDDSKTSLYFELPKVPHDAIVAATKGKQAFERLIVTDQQAIELGFESKAEAADTNIRLGQPFPLIVVNVEMLKKYEPNIPPQKLISFSKQYIFPIQTETSSKTKSSITVVEVTAQDRTQQRWKPIEWGKNGLIRPLVEVRKTHNDFDYSFAVWIPALSRYFIGVLKGKDFIIIPLYSEPDYGFSKGVPKSAVYVFEELVREAQSIPIPKRGVKKG